MTHKSSSNVSVLTQVPANLPAAFYEAELAQSAALLKSLQQKIRTIAMYRLIAGMACILSIYKIFRTFGATSWWIIFLLLVIIFIILFRKTANLKQSEAYQAHRKKINEAELAGLEGHFDQFDGGEEMAPPDHPFAFDLDLFGPRSLFQRINRTVTFEGKVELGNYFSAPEQNVQTICQRQSMVNALQNDPAWCQQFLINGSLNEEGSTDRENIENWLQLPTALFPDKTWSILLTVLPALTVICWLIFLFGPIPAWPAIVLSLTQLGIVGNKSKMINNTHQLISKRADTLKKYHNLVQLFTNKDFKEPGLLKLQATIQAQEQGQGAFGKLLKLINALDNRLNIIMNIFLNGLLLWDLNCLFRIERWKLQFKNQFPIWIVISGEVDALISLAIYNFNHPDYKTPDILDKNGNKNFLLDIVEGRHPLLYPEPSIPNDLHQPDQLNLFLITGANMAGKSTFLRMVGLNMVLAMSGANVAATNMSLTPVALYTSMRTNDSLFTHTSFFYAELKKLQWIMDQIRSGKPVYILLDEILKGTNSRDQHLGSAALIKNIIRYKGRGLIATHDIELTSMADDYADNLKNIAFEIDMEGDKMIFSYRYKDGVCQNMNASMLMKQMGIT